MQRLWRSDRQELAVLALTFCVSIARTVELAVLAGALGSLAVLLRQLMRPAVSVCALKTSAADVVRVRAALGVLYVSAELLERRVRSAAAAAALRPVLLDCQHHVMLDYAAVKVRPSAARPPAAAHRTRLILDSFVIHRC